MSSPFVSMHPVVLLWNLFQCIAILTGYSAEKKDASKYSKFGADLKESEKELMVSSKMGMLIIYTPAFLVSIAMCFVIPALLGDNGLAVSSVASLMLVIHFGKRDLEVLFLHKYSGSTLLSLARFIGTYYAVATFAIASVANPEPSELCTTVGTALFVTGTAGNFYHHYLLATLRQQSTTNGEKKATRRYLPPQGGLFEYVAAPHYLFELIGWLGIAVASHSLTGYLTFMAMSMYLAARASNGNEWNRKKFSTDEWPESRHNLVPFIF